MRFVLKLCLIPLSSAVDRGERNSEQVQRKRLEGVCHSHGKVLLSRHRSCAQFGAGTVKVNDQISTAAANRIVPNEICLNAVFLKSASRSSITLPAAHFTCRNLDTV